MTLIFIVNIFFINLLISLVLSTLIPLIFPQSLRSPYERIIGRLRESIIDFGRLFFEGETFEIKIIVWIVIPFFVVLAIAQQVIEFIPQFEDYVGVQIFLSIITVFLFIYSVPTQSDWDKILNIDGASALSIICKILVIIQYLQNQFINYFWLLFILIYPFSYHLQFINSRSESYNKELLEALT